MANVCDKAECLKQCLTDAGYDEKTADELIRLSDNGNGTLPVQTLKEKRRELLDGIHKKQKQLDCLDYLIFQTENKNGGTKK